MDRNALIALAHACRFAHVRFCAVGPTPHGEAFQRWLAQGHDGELGRWMRNDVETRLDPRVRMPTARTAMVLGVEHAHRRPPDPGGPTGLVARYAWGRDYHNLVGKRLDTLRRRLREAGVPTWGGVDTAPILEHSWASAAGLGFSGKNTLQILPAHGSWMVLAVVFLPLDVTPDVPLRDHCGRCTRCLTACPTDAFVGPRHLDATRCIAYWTIEASGLAPPALRPSFGRWVFGCDLCQEVCPHNGDRPDPDEADFAPRHAWLHLPTLLATPDADLDARFLGTPLRRPRPAGLKRNALIALANLGDEAFVPDVRHQLEHPEPVVRAAAVWALSRLGAKPPKRDASPLVQAEIDAAQSS
jgi:epoxyqueuosine reductase